MQKSKQTKATILVENYILQLPDKKLSTSHNTYSLIPFAANQRGYHFFYYLSHWKNIWSHFSCLKDSNILKAPSHQPIFF